MCEPSSDAFGIGPIPFMPKLPIIETSRALEKLCLHLICWVCMQNKLEEQLIQVSTIPKDVAEAAERAREKDRRTVAREEKLQLQKQEHVRHHASPCRVAFDWTFNAPVLPELCHRAGSVSHSVWSIMVAEICGHHSKNMFRQTAVQCSFCALDIGCHVTILLT